MARAVDLAPYENQIEEMSQWYTLHPTKGYLVQRPGMNPVAKKGMANGCLMTVGGLLTATVILSPIGIPLAVVAWRGMRTSKAIETEARRRARLRLYPPGDVRRAP